MSRPGGAFISAQSWAVGEEWLTQVLSHWAEGKPDAQVRWTQDINKTRNCGFSFIPFYKVIKMRLPPQQAINKSTSEESVIDLFLIMKGRGSLSTLL